MDEELKKLVEQINRATIEMRGYIDTKLEQVAKSGAADPLVQAAIDKANAEITELRARIVETEKASQRPAPGSTNAPTDPAIELRQRAFIKYLRYGMGESARGSMTPDEQRSLSNATDADGAFLIPTAWEGGVLMAAFNAAEVRPVVNVGSTGRDRVFVPSLKKPIVAWGVGALAVTAQDLSAGGETIPILDLKALALIHNNTLDDADSDIWGELSGAFATAVAEAEDLAFAAGDGATEPQGVMSHPTVRAAFTKTGVAAALGDGTVAHNGCDPLIDALHSLKKVYRRNATWGMTSMTEGLVRQLKDTTGQYLWQPPVAAGSPATLLGRPVINPEGMDEVGANKFPIVVGDFRTGYRVRDRSGLSVQRLVERYAEYDQTGFIIKRRTGGRVVMAEAFRCIKVAA